MFYVKERISDAAEVSVEINEENVFTRCPRCGKEVSVDLAELFHGDEDPISTAQQYSATSAVRLSESGGADIGR